MRSQNVSLKMDPQDIDRLRALAEARHRTPHYLMREAVQQYLVREEARAGFLREAVLAWSAFAENGTHATLGEVTTWLDTWGTQDETPDCPECHE